MRCLRAFGERIASHEPDRQIAEIQIRIALMNGFNALATAESGRVAGDDPAKGHVRLDVDFCNSACAIFQSGYRD